MCNKFQTEITQKGVMNAILQRCDRQVIPYFMLTMVFIIAQAIKTILLNVNRSMNALHSHSHITFQHTPSVLYVSSSH